MRSRWMSRPSGAPTTSRNFPTTAPRELRTDARAEQPFAPLARFLEQFGGRVLIAADSPGPPRSAARNAARRRPRRRSRSPAGRRSPTSDARLALTVAPDVAGPHAHRAAGRRHLRGAAVRRARAAGAAAQARGGRSRSDPARPAEPHAGRAGRARGIRRRPLRRPAAHGSRRPERRVPGARIPGRRSRLRAGARAASRHPLHRRGAGERAAAQARHGPVGEGAQARGRADSRRRRRAAGSLRAAQGAARA